MSPTSYQAAPPRTTTITVRSSPVKFPRSTKNQPHADTTRRRDDDCALLPPAVRTAQGKSNASADCEWQRRKTERCVVVLAEEILDTRVDRHVGFERIRRAQVELLISGREIAVRQQHGVPEKSVFEKRAVVSPSDHISRKRAVEFLAVVEQRDASGMRCDQKRPRALKRRERSDRYRWEKRIKRRSPERLRNDGVGVGVFALKEKSMAKIHFVVDLSSLCPLRCSVDVSAAEGRGVGDVHGNTDRDQITCAKE